MLQNENQQSNVKAQLMAALVDLGNDKPFLEISVKALCEKAGIHRSTFYRYYASTDEVLRDLSEQYFRGREIYCERMLDIDYSDFEKGKQAHKEIEKQHIACILQMREIFLFLISPNGDPYFRNNCKKSFFKYFRQAMERNISSGSIPTNYIINYFAAATLDSLHFWLENQDMSIEEFTDFTVEMLSTILSRYINKDPA